MDNATEEISTNREFQYDIFCELKEKLGRAPNLKEFQTYISNMSEDDVWSWIKCKRKGNGYLDLRYERNKAFRADDYKRAWREIARTNSNRQNTPSLDNLA